MGFFDKRLLKKYAKEADKVIIIVPEQFSFETEKGMRYEII